MHPQIAALALHNQVAAALAHHPHKHTAGYYAHKAASDVASSLHTHALHGAGNVLFGIAIVISVIAILSFLTRRVRGRTAS